MADNLGYTEGTGKLIRSTEVATNTHVQHLFLDSFSLRTDDTGTYFYIGEALPGVATSAAAWRIRRLTSADNTMLFADGDDLFNNVWDNRASLAYS